MRKQKKIKIVSLLKLFLFFEEIQIKKLSDYYNIVIVQG
jgi:hypothetical protein